VVGRLCHQVVDYDKDDTDNKVARYTIKRKREEAIPPPPKSRVCLPALIFRPCRQGDLFRVVLFLLSCVSVCW